MNLYAKNVLNHLFYEQEPQAVIMPYNYISLATLLQTHQEKHI